MFWVGLVARNLRNSNELIQLGSTAKPYLIKWDLDVDKPSEADDVKLTPSNALAGIYPLESPGVELKLDPPLAVEVINSRFELEKAAMKLRCESVL